MSKPTTHVLMTVDDSASMYALASDTRGGFNGYVDELQKDEEAKYRVTAAKFGMEYELLSNAAKPKDVPRLDRENYSAGQGGTALYDAIGRIIMDFERGTTLAEGDRVLLVIQTDGHENSSAEFTLEQIKTMIQDREKSGRWSCVFLAAGVDAWEQGAGMGFSANSVIKAPRTSGGTQSSYSGLVASTRSYSRGGTSDEVAEVLRSEVAKSQ